jgi:hydrogenase maturation protease
VVDSRVPPRILVAGFGNVLRADDGFGPAVIRELESGDLLERTVNAIDVGTGGFSLVLELLEGYDALVIVDAVDRGGRPGSLYVLEPEVPGPLSVDAIGSEGKAAAADSSPWCGQPEGIDAHVLTPGPAMIVARAAGALPPYVRIVGCQPCDTESLEIDLTPTVRGAVPGAIEIIRGIVSEVSEGNGRSHVGSGASSRPLTMTPRSGP